MQKVGSWYYLLDGIASLTAGYLFVINNYIPMLICLSFCIISTIISFKFNDIYEVERNKEEVNLKNKLKEYSIDLKKSFKFIFKSKRMKAFILFQITFYSLTEIIRTYSSDLLVTIGIPEEQFSIIFSVLTLIGGISLSFKDSIEKKYKNRTLRFISLIYIGACIIIGTVSSLYVGPAIIPLVLLMLAVHRISTSIWYILEYKYLKNFTTEDMRNKITFSYELVGGIAASAFSVLGGLLLEKVKVQNAYLLVGLFSLAVMIVVLDYMRKRFGLKPEEYKKEDLEL